ncbi:MAG: nucleotidyltransferase domain-containing protein [Caldilinea sp.]|nr:nucleotidyltransferase domain-containing protein [Caldilinea sp.]MCB0065638.1 nucleotidyltransferase domain-containing protein [Caldilineaceae bacterium]MCB0039148.1 nucleotidyltransferase domain-containing protein [Caldilinea sp.]MCB0054831.1 nucleotidyltransferase domain-containing protein [Caldilinea sp.]MCB0133612.1 nucleotidyltransferase domain-containing protein [Caldilineaceae bacterium]
MTDKTKNLPIPNAQLAAFCQRWQIEELSLFGSILDDQFNDESDVDVLVTFAPDVAYSFRHFIAMQDELEEIFGRRVDLVERSAVERSANYIRRRSILESKRPVYAR